jgi:hypothetical protein
MNTKREEGKLAFIAVVAEGQSVTDKGRRAKNNNNKKACFLVLALEDLPTAISSLNYTY